MIVQAVVRAFDILKLIARHPQGIGVTDIARQTNLHKSTVSRLISTLESVAAVERVPQGVEYQIKPDFLTFFIQAGTPQSLLALARPYMLELSAATGEDVGLAVPDGDQALFIDQIQHNHAVQVRDWTGSRLALHLTAAGKVLLAHASETVRQAYLAQPLVANTAHTHTDPHHLAEALSQVQQQGYAWIFEEFVVGLNAVAVPIFNQQGTVVAAISIYGPSFRFPPPELQSHINHLIINTGQKLTQQVQEVL